MKTLLNKTENYPVKCLHDSCPSCKGSGIKLNGGGICIHHIACNCPKHSVMC